MHIPGNRYVFRFALFALLALLIGCSEGPLWTLSINPWAQREFRAEQPYGPTYPEKVAELRRVREQAGRMQIAQQNLVSQQLLEVLKNEKSVLLRVELVRTLGYLKTLPAADALDLGLADEDAMVRIAACEAWSRHGTPRALQALAGVMSPDEALDVRMAAARELARFEDPRAVQALGKALDDHDPALQFRAMESLAEISDRDYGTDVASWRAFVRGENPPPVEGPSVAERVREFF